MRAKRPLRSLGVIASAALVLGAFVATPADAAKKKKKKKPAAPVCAPYTTPEWAGEAETTIVTDAATADEPVVVTLSTGPGLGFSSSDPGGGEGAPSSVFHNVVVDTAAEATSVTARLDANPAFDYDLWWRYPDGTPAASAAGFWVVPGGEGGETGIGYEQVNDVAAPDCTGFTAEIVSAVSPGGDVTLSIWLGE